MTSLIVTHRVAFFSKLVEGVQLPRNPATAVMIIIGIFISWSNADVLPPGQGRAVGVVVVGLMPAGSDVLFDF